MLARQLRHTSLRSTSKSSKHPHTQARIRCFNIMAADQKGNSLPVSLTWFKSTDLRLHDHEPLARSYGATWNPQSSSWSYPARPVCSNIAVYCFDPRLFGGAKTHYFGFPKTGHLRAQFIRESVADLQKRVLSELGIPLVVRAGEPEHVLPALCRKLQQANVDVRSVHAHSEVTSEELDVERAVSKALRALGIELHTHWGGSTVAHKDDIPFDTMKDFPDIYTQFRKAVEKTKNYSRPCVPPVPSHLTQSTGPMVSDMVAGVLDGAGSLPTLGELGYNSGAAGAQSMTDGEEAVDVTHADESKQTGRAGKGWAARKQKKPPVAAATGTVAAAAAAPSNGTLDSKESSSLMDFPGGETAALARLQHYFWKTNALAEYKTTRNGMLGSDYSSKFSPWLAVGALSPRYVFHQVREYEHARVANESTYWLTFELLWRDFFRFGALKYGNSIFHAHGPQHVKVPPPGGRGAWKQDMNLVQKWIDGETGYPFVDACMLELKHTGFMSNRGRQNVASFFTKDMEMDWRIGAEYFESVLLDYDPASNYGNWNYVAGVGCDPRTARYFNIIKQARNYDADGRFRAFWMARAGRSTVKSDKDMHLPTIVPLKFSAIKGDSSQGQGRGQGQSFAGKKHQRNYHRDSKSGRKGKGRRAPE